MTDDAALPSGTGQVILVAEDDKFYSKVYKTKLAKEGINAIIVGNGDLAVKEAIAKNPKLILLDIMMPIKDGFTALAEIKANPKTKNIPVIMLSNLGQAEDIAKAKKLGAHEYVVKSDISLTDMVQKIKNTLK